MPEDAPVECIEARYSSDGSLVTLHFDKRPTDRAGQGLGSKFPCQEILDEATVARIQGQEEIGGMATCGGVVCCKFLEPIDEDVLQIELNAKTGLRAGDKLAVGTDTIGLYCSDTWKEEADGRSCEETQGPRQAVRMGGCAARKCAANCSVPVELPAVPTKPTAALKADTSQEPSGQYKLSVRRRPLREPLSALAYACRSLTLPKWPCLRCVMTSSWACCQ